MLLDLFDRTYTIMEMNNIDIEKLLRDIIKKGDEYDKVDLKSSYDFSQRKDRIRLVKCIAAIANSDSTYFDNIGYIVLGAKRGKLVGGFDALEKDLTSANMQNWVRDYLDPKVIFSVQRFEDPEVGWWGAIVIPASTETHVFRKEYSEQSLNIRRGDVYVRDGDSIILADKSDHDRLQRRKLQNTIKEFERKVEILEAKIEEHKFIQPDLKLFFTDEKKNLFEELDVHPIFDVKSKDEHLSGLSEDREIKKVENELANLRNEIETSESGGILFSVGLKRVQLEDYEKALKEYLGKLKEFKLVYQEYLSKFSQVISLNFALLNTGNSFAQGITFYLSFPGDLIMSKELDFFKKPEFHEIRPKYPTHSLFADVFKSGPLITDLISPFVPVVKDFSYGGPIVDKSNKNIKVEYWVNKLLHGHMFSFDPIYVLSPDHEIEVNIEYSIYAENVPGETEGTLLLRIKPEKR